MKLYDMAGMETGDVVFTGRSKFGNVLSSTICSFSPLSFTCLKQKCEIIGTL
jgi:hypothetical protein